MNAKKRVFITGATGFVGAWATRALVAEGHDVHALLLEGEREDALATERFGDVANAKVTRVAGDFLRPESYFGALEKLRPDACVHLAWYANPKDYLASRINLEFLDATLKLGTKLIDLECPRFVAAGTCFEYDTRGLNEQNGVLAENAPIGPQHLYSTCKHALHEVLAFMMQGTKTSFAWPRLFFLYGEYEAPGRLVPAVIDALLSGDGEARVSTGEQIRDYMHNVDAGRAIAHLVAPPGGRESLTGPINVATGDPIPVRRVIETIANVIGGDAAKRIKWGAITPRPNDPAFICANIDKLKASGFTCSSTLEQGLRATVEAAKKKIKKGEGKSS